MQHRADMAVKDREIDDLNQQLVDLTKEYEELSENKIPTNNNILTDNLKKTYPVSDPTLKNNQLWLWFLKCSLIFRWAECRLN